MQWALLGTTLVMGFLGSWHCSLMCGPLSCAFKHKKDFLSYHIGRLISYLLIASVLFWGSHFFLNTDSRILKLVSAVIFMLVFVYFGLIQLEVFKNIKYFSLLNTVQFSIFKKSKNIIEKFPIVLGLLTGLFPCGWLYSFLVLSTQAKNIETSLLLILIFWGTSLPAFAVFNGFMQSLIKNSPISYQKISGFILIFAGILSVIGHWAAFVE